MTIPKVIAIALIFILACAGWVVLGATTTQRSTDTDSQLGAEVKALWGRPLVQNAPSFSIAVPGTDRVRSIIPSANDVHVTLKADHRKKGLLWYPTYTCRFEGAYTVENKDPVTQKIKILFQFPSSDGTFDEFAATIDDKPIVAASQPEAGLGELIELPSGQRAVFKVSYLTRGIGEWRYRLASSTGRVQNLSLTAETDFAAVDYPEGSLSPMQAQPSESGGMTLAWKASDLITEQDIGVVIPEKINPGPLTARITFFAPVCLLFFFVLVFTISLLYKINIHPMHYLFVAAGFFAFHLLLAYMAGLVNIHMAFIISAVVSVALVTSYLSGALRGAFPNKVAVSGQLFFLVLFSYSFFFNGITGLTVAIGSVITLAVLMKVTAHVNWDEAFARPSKTPPPLPGGNG